MNDLANLLKANNFHLVLHKHLAQTDEFVLYDSTNTRAKLETTILTAQPQLLDSDSLLVRLKKLAKAKEQARLNHLAAYIVKNKEIGRYPFLHILEHPWQSLDPFQPALAGVSLAQRLTSNKYTRATTFAFLFADHKMRYKKL
jgi:hypothetical protein